MHYHCWVDVTEYADRGCVVLCVKCGEHVAEDEVVKGYASCPVSDEEYDAEIAELEQEHIFGANAGITTEIEEVERMPITPLFWLLMLVNILLLNILASVGEISMGVVISFVAFSAIGLIRLAISEL